MVDESASSVLVFPSMKVMGSISGFLLLVACTKAVHSNTHYQIEQPENIMNAEL